jgi:hypothetical protein
MEVKEKAHLKDKILKILSDQKSGADTFWLFFQFDKDYLTMDYLKKILVEISESSQDVLLVTKNEGLFPNIGKYYQLEPTPNTQNFLNSGGFVAEYEKHFEASEKLNESVNQDIIIKELTKKNLILANELSENNIKYYKLPLIISGLSLFTAIFLPFLSKAFESDNNKELINRVDLIQKELKEVKNSFKSENDSLKSELYKAEMLISVFEDKAE